jgi:non-ribosomal peptide synthase protein (TIGR01720 family)
VELADHHIEPLPIDFDRGPNVIWAQDTVRESLEQPTTDRLLHAFLGHHKLGINDVLLAALVETLCTWSGQRELLIELQGHGREVQLYENLDVSRLVGRLSTNYPVLLELPATEGIDRVHAVHKQLARIPRGGTDYGLMRYLSSDTGLRAQVGKIRRADVSFNYVGQIDAPAQLAEEPKIFYKGTSDIYPPEAPRRYRLVVQGMVLAGQLHFDWLYSTHHHKRATVQALASRHLETVRAYVESF